MNVRAQVAAVFHLDKCIGCHTCSVACKNIWTDRKGAEYMWWNNVETKPGTGYPNLWEDQEEYRGGWTKDKDGELHLKLFGKKSEVMNVFSNPYLPDMDDYYEPWTYDYEELFNAPEGDDQPTARPISLVSGKEIDINNGPNWDDDLGGSPFYAATDPNLEGLTDEEKAGLMEVERLTFFYLPRICNHCLNPGCVGACPVGAAYKRGEDGIVLISQEKCRAWRMCISGCPYKKVYFNWGTGKSEKCILCFPRLESGQAPACFHSCVGRIRYLGVLLYDADRIKEVASAAENDLVEAQRSVILDPFNQEVIEGARKNGIPDSMIDAAKKSPVYKFFKVWKLALPLHPEFRTLPNVYYVPPMQPVMARVRNGQYDVEGAAEESRLSPLMSTLERARIPIRFMAHLFSAGNEEVVEDVYRKLIAVRVFMRSKQVKDVTESEVSQALGVGKTSSEEADAIYRLTSLPTFDERFVVPPLAREQRVEASTNPQKEKGEQGFGIRRPAERRW